MRLRYTPRAARDLVEIAEFLQGRNPAAALAVRAAILRSLQTLSFFPAIGRRQNVESVRMLVTRRYGYLIYYTPDDAREEIAILTIQHPSRRRPYSDL